MQTGFTYASQGQDPAAIYAPEGWDAPPTLTLRNPKGELVPFARVSDRELFCGAGVGSGSCDDYECHRRELGVCQCGRHPEGVPIRRAS